MNRKSIGLVVIIVSAVMLARNYIPSLPQPSPMPDNTPSVEVPDELREALTASFADKREDAMVWSGMLEGLARYIDA